jgi:endonuclease/exonuclease/phosphatase family metal-dependent hydrolase
MAVAFRKITKRVFIIINICFVVVFLLACLNIYLNPQQWWPVALLGLGFPFLLIIVFGFFVFWVIFRSKWAFLSLAAMLIGFTNIRALVAFNFRDEFELKKEPGTLRVLTWNVSWFDHQNKPTKTTKTYRKQMLDYIAAQDADVLCFQEYIEPDPKKFNYNNRADIMALGYPYHYMSRDYSGWKNWFHLGVALFSKYPILDTFHIRYPGSVKNRAAESLIGADILVDGKKVRIFTTHLQSILLRPKDYNDLEKIKNAEDSIIEASKSLVKKLKQGYTFRGDQVDIVRTQLDSSSNPVIICGDFNDIPNSYSYFQIKGDRQDAFVQAGRGLGRTFAHISPTLRIDYIMADEAFDVLRYRCPVLPYSEHYPVIADLRLRD